MASYPKWLYHPLKPPCVVADEAEHKAMGPDWVESPADAKRVTEALDRVAADIERAEAASEPAMSLADLAKPSPVKPTKRGR